jgi:hypothetical protein
MEITAPSNVAKIRELNDILRTTFVGGSIMVTNTVEALPVQKRSALLAAIRAFDAFTDNNDPHSEHDFVSIKLDDDTYFGKIDYYDRDLTGGSEDPADPAKTCRVLTIMHSSDY